MQNFQTLLNELKGKDEVTGTVYHYRNGYGSFSNILKKKQLRMTHYQHLPGEINYSLSSLKKMVSDRKLKFPPPNKKIVQRSFWGCFEFYQTQLNVFITSLCLNRDDKYLWEEYGKHGLGFAIGFSKEFINSAFSPNNGEGIYNESNWTNVVMKVYYGETELRKIGDGILEVLLSMEQINDPKLYWEMLIDLYSKIIPELPRFKEEKYEREKEYRLYAMDLDLFEKRIPRGLIENDGKPRMFSEQIPFQFINEIIIGSKNNFDEIKKQIGIEFNNHHSGKNFEEIRIEKSRIEFA